MSDTTTQVKIAGDVVASITLGASVMSWLPTTVSVVGGALGIIWFVVQLWESKTISGVVERWTERRRIRRIRYLEAKQKVILAKLRAAETVRGAKVQASELVQSAKAEAAVDQAIANIPTT